MQALPINVLERYWNHTAFRPLQEDIINSVLQNNDVLTILPTGGGKSICYQIPALILDGVCIVISPLIALMEDQVQQLKIKGIKAEALISGTSKSDINRILDNCIYGHTKLLYLSPERLEQDLVKQKISQMQLSLIAVDEAHCISQWGHDFRPAYHNIAALRTLHPNANVIALTATARPNVKEDIITRLDFVTHQTFEGPFYKPNLALQLEHTEDKINTLIECIQDVKGASIIYTRSRQAAIDTSDTLNQKGLTSAYFHGGLTTQEKRETLNNWLHNRTPIMVATSAFGMGIDKKDVRKVVHINLPESLENYYQEAGRAGRDGLDAQSIILKGPNDESRLQKQFLDTLPKVEFIKLVYRKLCNYFQVTYGELPETGYVFNFSDFCKTYKLHSTLVFNSLNTLNNNGVINLTNTYTVLCEVQFTAANKTLFTALEKQPQYNTLVKTLLRSYGGIQSQLTKINMPYLTEKLNRSEDTIITELQDLQKQELLSFNYSKNDSILHFLTPREDDKTINRIAKIIIQQTTLKTNQINAVVAYCNNTKDCRQQLLAAYFEIPPHNACNNCSNCKPQKRNSKNVAALTTAIIFALRKTPLSALELKSKLQAHPDDVVAALQWLLEQDDISLGNANRYQVK